MGTNERRRRSNLREIAFLVGLIGVLVVAGLLFSWNIADRSVARVRFATDEKVSPVFKLEVADTDPKRQLGLMYRKSMAANRGMIFIFPEERVQRFWMKDTYLSLDMIFVNRNWEVVGVLNSVPPLNQESRFVDAPSLYVIELNAGTAKAHNIGTGTKVQIEGEIPRT